MNKKQIITVIIGLLALWGVVDLLSHGVPLLDTILAIASVGILVLAIIGVKKIFDKTWEQGAGLAKTIKEIKSEKENQ